MLEDDRNELELLHEIRQKLDQMERNNWARAIERLDISEFALDLRRARDAAFPAGYFTDWAWEILLYLYQAKSANKNVEIDSIACTANIPEDVMSRYIDMLMRDGFIYKEEDIIDCRRTYVLLTSKGVEHMESLFGQIQYKIEKLVGVTNNSEAIAAKEIATR